MEYGSKLLVIGSMAAAVLLETFLVSRLWPAMWPLTIAVLIAAGGLALVYEEAVMALVLGLAFVMPALLVAVHGKLPIYYGTFWAAALLGAMLPRSARRGWSFPRAWKFALVLWAVTIACLWPLVVLREVDFSLALLNVNDLSSSGRGVAPPTVTVWICDVAATLGLGLLWFDWLFATQAQDRRRFYRWTLVPLVASFAISTAAGVYQLFGDIRFLNDGLFGYLGRASGTMLDANPFGVVAALFGLALIALAWSQPNRTIRWLAVGGFVASWLGLWASAARSAFGAGCIGLAFLLYAVVTQKRAWIARLRRQRALAAGVLIGLVAVVALVAIMVPAGRGPIRRLLTTGSGRNGSAHPVVRVASELWVRNGYGKVATSLIRRFPWFGIGIGSFHVVVPDFYYLLTRSGFIVPDNAQNWYRHQLAEMGLIGGIGWILWVLSFAWYVVRRPLPESDRFVGLIVKGILVALGIISLVGMPTQNITVSISFWMFAFWYVSLAGEPQPSSNQQSAGLSRAAWVALCLIVGVVITGTAWTARRDLRVARRAAAAGWPYAYGFNDSVKTIDVAHPSSAWAGQHAVVVLAPSAGWVKLSVSVDRLNVIKKPVDVRVWCDGQLVIDRQVPDARPVVQYVPVHHGRMIVETKVGSVVRPADYGLEDSSEHGLLLSWDFITAPPNAASLNRPTTWSN